MAREANPAHASASALGPATDRPPSTPSSARQRPLRLPASLRRQQIPRKASNPHLSLVFADPSLSHGAKPSRPGSLASEDALSRQLDAGGQAMGLRSRRSSSATVRTVRTLSGVSSPGIEEEGEAEASAASEAGPSTLRLPSQNLSGTSNEGFQSPEAENMARQVSQGYLEARIPLHRPNPKESSSWLRWNSPAPAFPRSRAASTISRGTSTSKGKERELDAASFVEGDNRPALSKPPDPVPPAGTKHDSERLVSASQEPLSTAAVTAAPPPDPPPQPLPPEPSLQVPQSSSTSLKPPITPRRNWWSRAASPTPRQKARSITKQDLAGPADRTPSHDATPSKADIDNAIGSENNGPGVPGPADARQKSPSPAGAAAHRRAAAVPTNSQPSLTQSAAQPNIIGSDPLPASVSVIAETPIPPTTSGDNVVQPPPPPPVSGWRAYLWGSSTTILVQSPAQNASDAPITQSLPASAALADTAAPARITNNAVVNDISARADAHVPVTAAFEFSGEPVEETQAPIPDSNAPSSQRPSLDAENATATETSIATQPTGQGWGTFLYSLVAPQLAVARLPPPATSPSDAPKSVTGAVARYEVANDALAARPEETLSIPAPEQAPEAASSVTAGHTRVPGVPPLELEQVVPDPDQAASKAAAATSTTTSWLSYLAYRSSQKTIKNGSIRSSAPRNSSETNEEIMDFSNDPDFPNEAPSASEAGASAQTQTGALKATIRAKDDKQLKGSIQAALTKDKEKMPPPKSIPNKSSALSIRGKRLSISSTRSGGSLTPLSSSPKTSSGVPDSKAVAPDPSPKPSGAMTALPPPPAVPAQQPNLVVPTFASTFDRPPRSFLPVPAASSGPETAPATSGTSSLAWRALSAAGSYVYSGSTADKGRGKAELEKPDTPQDETRGRKEGRNIGADLPRRVGLDGADADAGWKHVRRVAVIGVHGWFPAKMLNSVIGEPTGTSQKFANMMGYAVKQFFTDRGVDDIRLTLMPLEGEGTIDSRVDRLYKSYLSNPAWINDLRRADAIFFAAHSQGCIVTTHLLSRMIAQGHIRTPLNSEAVARCEWGFGPIGLMPPDSRLRGPGGRALKNSFGPVQPGSEGGYQKVCMLAMCGVHLGPLYSISTSTVIQPYLQWFENAAARELFDFQENTSAVSQAYHKALSMVLENEVKVVLLASLNDQVVPIYGASFSTANHPLLLRALFVDGASYSQTDFMTNLLSFAFMLRNAGLDDQRLIEHLSEATAGSLTGVGHSTPYEEPQSYALAVQYLFLSGPARQPVTPLQVEPFSARDTRNEYELPWIMRALVDSPEVKDLFPGELKDLKEGVLRWKPVTKVLKEIKKRLEPMAGRQSRLRPIPNSPSSLSINTLGETASVGSVGRARETQALA